MDVKKIFLGLIATLFFMAITCKSRLNELGDDSAYFEYNGVPVIPQYHCCMEDQVYLRRDERDSVYVFQIGDDSLKVYVQFRMPDFHGPGLYRVEPGSSTTCRSMGLVYDYDDWGIMRPASAARTYVDTLWVRDHAFGNTYLRVLNYDEPSGHVEAVFEAHVSGQGVTDHFTHGRLILHSN